MKTTMKLLRFLAACGSAFCLTACITTTTTTTAPDGTVTTVCTTVPAIEAIEAGAVVAAHILDEK